jgi:hypothetical protein
VRCFGLDVVRHLECFGRVRIRLVSNLGHATEEKPGREEGEERFLLESMWAT